MTYYGFRLALLVPACLLLGAATAEAQRRPTRQVRPPTSRPPVVRPPQPLTVPPIELPTPVPDDDPTLDRAPAETPRPGFIEAGVEPADLEQSPLAIADRQPLPIAPNDSPLVRLRKERFNAALAQVRDSVELYRLGRLSIGDVFQPASRLTTAAEGLLRPAEVSSLLSECVELAKQIEISAKGRAQAGVISSREQHEATYNRADLELRLLERQTAQTTK